MDRFERLRRLDLAERWFHYERIYRDASYTSWFYVFLAVTGAEPAWED